MVLALVQTFRTDAVDFSATDANTPVFGRGEADVDEAEVTCDVVNPGGGCVVLSCIPIVKVESLAVEGVGVALRRDVERRTLPLLLPDVLLPPVVVILSATVVEAELLLFAVLLNVSDVSNVSNVLPNEF